jgi:AraC-like DNA-binding protein
MAELFQRVALLGLHRCSRSVSPSSSAGSFALFIWSAWSSAGSAVFSRPPKSTQRMTPSGRRTTRHDRSMDDATGIRGYPCYDRLVLQYVARPPRPALASMIEYVWASQGAPPHARECVMPTGTLELFVALVDGGGQIHNAAGRDLSFSGVMGVAGAYRRPFTFETREDASVVGVHFRPGQAGVVLGVPPGELMDRHVDLEDIWGRRARELRERLCAATTTSERLAILEAELASRLDTRRVHPAVTYALDVLARPQARVGDIAKAARLSQRRLIELFTAAVGITPKRCGRIWRFHRATALARSAALDWTRVAHACGYYDQAHLIRDCHELADMTPSDLMRASVHVKEHHQIAMPR